MSRPTRLLVHAGLLSLFLPPVVVAATHDENNAAHARCAGTTQAGALAPVPADPYPLMAAGWGPESGRGLMASRWAEDWSGVRNAGRAPAFKAMALGDAARLTLSSEVRLRHAVSDNAKLVRGDDFAQTQLRAIVGADLRVDPHLRIYGELGTARVDTRRATATPNFRNDLALQQLFADMHVVGRRDGAGDTLLGVMIGRQEFSDGPRQLVSLSDGPSLHRSWNGVRLYAHGARYRVGAFDLRATRLGHGGFDETTDHAEALRGLTASFIVSRGEGPNTYLDPFWFHATNPRLRVAGRTGRDDRDTIGARLWGRVGAARFDWTAARQSGNSIDGRRIDAWGIFAVQSLALSDDGWKARMTSRVDVASGGGAYGSGPIRDFHPLYASSNYLGEGQFLGLSNLLMVTPGIALSPTPHTTLSFEYGHARRLRTNDAVYAGGLRAYAGTQDVSGHDVGRLARVSGNWNATPNLSLSMNVEHFAAGDALARAGYPSGHYAYVSATYRY